MKNIIIFGLLLLTLVVTRAQDETYRLREPSAAEYVRTINKHIKEYGLLEADTFFYNHTVSALSASVLYLIDSDNTATFTDLYEAYNCTMPIS